jgi:hypothetical protein
MRRRGWRYPDSILITVVAVNVSGDALRDAAEPASDRGVTRNPPAAGHGICPVAMKHDDRRGAPRKHGGIAEGDGAVTASAIMAP